MRHPSKGLRPSLMFSPHVATRHDGTQTLVQIFVDAKEDGTFEIDSVFIATRDRQTDPWSTPIKAKRP